MAGGSGERFWPVSRTNKPKQLLRLTDPDRTLLAESVDRVAPLVGRDAVYALVGTPIAQEVRLSGAIEPTNVVIEPAKRNTLGCLCWFAANLLAKGQDETSMAILTADHKIGDEAVFRRNLETAFECAEQTEGLATFGILPSRAETGYGYIETSDEAVPGVAQIAHAFREKPDAITAAEYVASGRFLWNSGMFIWTLQSFLRELQAAQPEASRLTLEIADALRSGNEATAATLFDSMPSISVDYALMERASKVYVIPGEFPWDDVGAWDAVLRTLPLDERGNAAVGDVLLEGARDCVIYNGGNNMTVAVLGMQDVVVVAADDAVLVCPVDRAQEIRNIVARLKEREDPRL